MPLRTLFLLLLTAGPARAAVRLAGLLGAHMLQRDQPVRLWDSATPGGQARSLPVYDAPVLLLDASLVTAR